MKALILSVGNEIISGRIADTNAAWLSERLEAIGIPVVLHVAVGDDEAALTGELARVSELADLVIVTGGLGPTRDDITRQAIAAAAGADLELDEPTLEHMRRRFERLGYGEMPPSNRIQACVPAGAELLPNSNGTAAGIRMELGRAEVFVMPGVPREMFAMYERSVEPVIRGMLSGRLHLTGTLECFGTTESMIDSKIHDLMAPGANPEVGLLAKMGQITVKIVARSDSETGAREMIGAAKAEVRKRLGDVIFGEDGAELEEIVGRLLAERAMTLATAESCTGGLIAKKITDVPGSSAYFLSGCVTYTNESKTNLLGVPQELFGRVGAVSEEVAGAMAEGCRGRSGADIAVSTTGIAGPGGGTDDKPVGLVFIGVADVGGVQVHRHETNGDRIFIRERSARLALDYVRRRLLG